jgi:hypothetical protein
MINYRRTLAASSLALCIAATAAPAAAQYYTLNGKTPPPSVAQYMAANGLPSGNYWLTNQGYWGVMGSNEPLGNIYAGRSSSRPHRSLSERGRNTERPLRERETRYSIAAAFRMQTIVAEAGFCDTLRIVCGRSER